MDISRRDMPTQDTPQRMEQPMSPQSSWAVGMVIGQHRIIGQRRIIVLRLITILRRITIPHPSTGRVVVIAQITVDIIGASMLSNIIFMRHS